MSRLRLTILAHFDADNRVHDYVIELVKALAEVSTDVLVVSACALPAAERAKLEPFARVLVRKNEGYDFGSWKAGLRHVSAPEIYDEIVLCNDSVYGPLFPLEEMFRVMSERKLDIWGVTANSQFGWHLQSYFVVYSRRVVMSRFFQEFWRGVEVLPSKFELILKYEVGLSHQALREGFSMGAYFEPSLKQSMIGIARNVGGIALERLPSGVRNAALSSWPFGVGYSRHPLARAFNPTHMFADVMVRLRVPFAKIELLRSNPHKWNLSRVRALIGSNTRYDLSLIDRHLATAAASSRR